MMNAVRILLLMMVMLGSSLLLSAQSTADLSKSIELGNAKELANHFDANIDLNIPESEGVYSKAQAEMILRNFFAENKPTSYSINHEGKSKTETHFTIGTLQTKSQAYRTYILFQKSSDQMRILELRIEAEE